MLMFEQGKAESREQHASLLLANLDRFEALQEGLIAQRKRKGLTQADLASRLGVTQPAISAFENNRDSMRLTTLLAYASALGVTLDLGFSEGALPQA